MFVDTSHVPEEEGYERTSELMTAGNNARERAKDNSILALGIATRIHRMRKRDRDERPSPKPRNAYIIRSLKRPEEVKLLRDIYGTGFYAIAAHNDYEKRLNRLTGYLNIGESQAEELISRDFEENDPYGQRLNKTFSLADFFIRIDAEGGDADLKTQQEVERITHVIFGHPYTTPTFDEYAMYFAFIAALRSADLSRQVGAVIAKDEQIIAHGANECPKYGGGLYWPHPSEEGIVDTPNGRDFMRKQMFDGSEITGFDSNEIEKKRMINEIIQNAESREFIKQAISGELQFVSDVALRQKIIQELVSDNIISISDVFGQKPPRWEGIEPDEWKRIAALIKSRTTLLLRKALEASSISDITEYGRVVHAEMEALLSCGRIGVSPKNGTLYSTTFPCHNCAKHIIAAGISRVVYIEPYPKSKAIQFHDDSINLGFQEQSKRVHFEPFVGVGPRRFFDLFSLRHGSGRDVKRKQDGLAVTWEERQAELKIQLSPLSYLDLEELARDKIKAYEIGETIGVDGNE